MAASTAVTSEDVPRRLDDSSRTAQVAALTGLRGLAALMVVVVHVSGRTDHPGVGVPGYGPVSLFVLSGYLLYRPWARWGMRVADRPSLRVFARRRVARIFPAYLVVLLAVMIVHPASRLESIGGWARAVTLTWIYDSGELPTALLQTWSLATELSWYVALPVMAAITGLVTRRFPPRTGFWIGAAMISLGLAVSIVWRWWVSAENLEIYFTYSFWLPGFLVCFAGGALVAHVVEGRRAGLVAWPRLHAVASDPWALLVLVLAAALLATSSLGGPDGYVARAVAQQQLRFGCAMVIAVTLLVIVVLGTHRSPLNVVLSTTWFGALGRWSYGIYLWHLPLIVMTEEAMTFPGGWTGLVARLVWIFGISTALGAATYAWVELPAIRWSQRPTALRSSHHLVAEPATGSVRTPGPGGAEPESQSQQHDQRPGG